MLCDVICIYQHCKLWILFVYPVLYYVLCVSDSEVNCR